MKGEVAGVQRRLEACRVSNGKMTRADGLAGDRACGSMMFPRARESLSRRTARGG
jgi:hypothetical protein